MYVYVCIYIYTQHKRKTHESSSDSSVTATDSWSDDTEINPPLPHFDANSKSNTQKTREWVRLTWREGKQQRNWHEYLL